jgi:PAS domain-containing protein
VAAVLGVLALGGAVCVGQGTNALVRSVGVSGQIHAFCSDAGRAAALASFCEEIRSKLIARLGAEQSWRAPVVVVFRERPAGSALAMPGEEAPLRRSATSVSGFLRFQIEAETPPPVDASRFVRAVVGTLCAEMANQKLEKVEGGQQIARVPVWLEVALTRKLEERPREAMLEPLKQAMAAERVPTFRQVTEAAAVPADPAAAALYGAQCEALLEGMEGQLDGRAKVRRFLQGLKPGEDWMRSFRAAFGEGFGYPVGAEKWWALVMVRASSMIVAQNYTVTETRRRLAEALVVVVPEKRSGEKSARGFWSSLWPFHGSEPKQEGGVTTLDKVLSLCEDPKALPGIVAPAAVRLRALAALAHPLYRGAIHDYLEGIHGLQKEDVKRFRGLVERATQECRRADRDAEAITNYVGSVEASLFPEDMAKRFGGWFKGGGSGEERLRETTPLNSYLDHVESTMPR